MNTGGNGAKTKRQHLVLADSQNRLVAAADIDTTLFSTYVSAWSDATCDRKDTVFRDTLDGNFKFPACLLVNHITNFGSGGVPANEYDKVIWTWYRDNKVSLPKTVIFTTYVKYFAGDFVKIRYWLNPDLTGIPSDTASAWNQSPWHRDSIQANPLHSSYIQALQAWNKALVGANRESLYDGKPSISSLPALPTLTK